MKKKIFLTCSLLAVFAVLFSMVFSSFASNASNNDFETKASKLEKNHGVKLTQNKEPKIKKDKIKDIADKFAENYTKDNKLGEYISANLTDERITIDAIPEKAKSANSKLKDKNSFSDIPVWIVTYEGLDLKRGDTTITEDNLVFDSETGEFLYGFR